MSTRLGAGRGRAFGSGWISGVLSVTFSGLAYGGVLCLLFPDVVVVADLSQYTVHRCFHRAPGLWRFHAIHHSSRQLDWLAGSRLHPVDVVVTRGLSFVPLYVLGFAPGAVYAYLVFVSFHAVFIHANVRFEGGGLRHVLVLPRFHHWHHAVEPVDRNFAVHLPWIDRLFGTHHDPAGRWPEAYGRQGDGAPETWLAQLAKPFRRERSDRARTV